MHKAGDALAEQGDHALARRGAHSGGRYRLRRYPRPPRLKADPGQGAWTWQNGLVTALLGADRTDGSRWPRQSAARRGANPGALPEARQARRQVATCSRQLYRTETARDEDPTAPAKRGVSSSASHPERWICGFQEQTTELFPPDDVEWREDAVANALVRSHKPCQGQ